MTNVPDTIDPALLDLLIDEHRRVALPRLERLWAYYRNDMTDRAEAADNGRGYRLAQETGLPARFRRSRDVGQRGDQRWETVIENDIGWRVAALVDFMFGRPLTIQSNAGDPARADAIEALLHRVFNDAGGIVFFQNLGLLGSVYGYVDVVVRVDGGGAIALDVVEAPRAVALLNPHDYRVLDAYVLHFRRQLNQVASEGFLERVRSAFGGGRTGRRAFTWRTEVWTAERHQQFDDGGDGRKLVLDEPNRLGRLPVVHVQNLPLPFFHEGLSEVEPLIPLQDELNTRLSDRANRVTFQSFKMYLGKGIDDFIERPVGPGQMWQTDNDKASIEAFGGDAASPSEEAHIRELREAMDKASAVTPIVAGLLHDKVGNLTSENALRITLMGLLAKTQKKRMTYGAGLERLCELVLHAADVHGVLNTRPEERGVRIDWPSPIPENQSELLEHARVKLELGVPRRQVLMELGYESE